MKDRFKSIICFLGSLFLFIFLSSFIAVILRRFGLNVADFDDNDYVYFQCLVETIFALIVYLIYRKIVNSDSSEFKTNFKVYAKEIFKYVVIFFCIKVISSLLSTVVGNFIGVDIGDSENQSLIVSMTKSSPILMLISTVLLAPFAEEGIFRLGLKRVIKNKYIFMVISGLLFGFMHIFPTDLGLAVALTYSITYVSMGIYLAYIYTETDNIWICVIVHAINNLISMVAIMHMM